MSGRLPIAGTPGVERRPLGLPAGHERRDSQRLDVCIAGVRDSGAAARLATLAVESLAAEGPVAVLVVSRGAAGLALSTDSPFPAGSVPARLCGAGAEPVARLRLDDAAAAPGAVDEALAALSGATLVVLGADYATLVVPRLTVVVTEGAATSTWDALGRAVFGLADVALAEPRPAFARSLGALLRGEA